MGVDRAVFLWLNGLAGKNAALDALVTLLANEYLVPVGLALGLLFLWFAPRHPERDRWQLAALGAGLAVGIANAAVAVSNNLYYRERPFADLAVHLLFYRPPDSSFPSNPAAVGFAVTTGVWLRDRSLAPPFFLLAAMLGLARVVAGVHYPSDVLAGALVGVAAALVAQCALGRGETIVRRLLSALRKLGLA